MKPLKAQLERISTSDRKSLEVQLERIVEIQNQGWPGQKTEELRQGGGDVASDGRGKLMYPARPRMSEYP